MTTVALTMTEVTYRLRMSTTAAIRLCQCLLTQLINLTHFFRFSDDSAFKKKVKGKVKAFFKRHSPSPSHDNVSVQSPVCSNSDINVKKNFFKRSRRSTTRERDDVSMRSGVRSSLASNDANEAQRSRFPDGYVIH
jgi:hypothetical protein